MSIATDGVVFRRRSAILAINRAAIEENLTFKIQCLATMHADGYSEAWMDWEEVGRCYYYLQDEQAGAYLLRAAHSFPPLQHGSWLIHRANLYALAGDRAGIMQVVGQLQALKSHAIPLPEERHFHLFLLACGAFLLGDYATAIAYRAPYVAGFAPEPPPAHVDWVMTLAQAALDQDVEAADRVAQHLAVEIVRCDDQPWDTAILNHWDWYERARSLTQSFLK